MQQLIEYIFLVLGKFNIEEKSEEENEFLLEITKVCNQLSREELRIVLSLFDVYEDYVGKLRRAYYELSEEFKRFDQKAGNNVASSELTSMHNLIDKENCKLQFLGKVCDIASNRISSLPRI